MVVRLLVDRIEKGNCSLIIEPWVVARLVVDQKFRKCNWEMKIEMRSSSSIRESAVISLACHGLRPFLEFHSPLFRFVVMFCFLHEIIQVRLETFQWFISRLCLQKQKRGFSAI